MCWSWSGRWVPPVGTLQPGSSSSSRHKSPRLSLTKSQRQGPSVSSESSLEHTHPSLLLPSRKSDPRGPPTHLGGERRHFNEAQISTGLQKVVFFPAMELLLFVLDETVMQASRVCLRGRKSRDSIELGWSKSKAPGSCRPLKQEVEPGAEIALGSGWHLSNPHPVISQVLCPMAKTIREGVRQGGGFNFKRP